jgi:phosphoglycolate phosphatase
LSSLATGGADVLLDLDGTLTDPRDGIVRCIQYALEQLGADVPDAAGLEQYIGPPIRDTFRDLLPGRETAVERAVALYRERFVPTGMFENRLYVGIPELLKALNDAGLRLHLCTSKPHPYARRILEHFALAPFFASIHGSELDGTRNEKSELVAHVLRCEALSAARCRMVGDRRFDIEAAAHHAVASVGVLWGYGSRAELEAAGARWLVETPGALRALLLQAMN